MIDPEHNLSIKQQAAALGISRGSVYYMPRPVSDADLMLMRKRMVWAVLVGGGVSMNWVGN